MTRNDGRASTVVSVFCALCLFVLPSLSRAAERDRAGARVLFAEGRKLVDTGNYAEACPKFEDSFRLDPGIGTNFNLADCLEHVGRPASAWARFLDVAAGTKAAGQVDRERVARARAAALEPKLAWLVVEVSSPVDGLVVERDGIAVGLASWGVSVPVDPGDHLVEATAPGRKKWSQKTKVPDAPTTISVSVPALETLPPDKLPSADPISVSQLSPMPAPPPRAEPARRWSIPVVALGALGAVALATGGVFAFKIQSENGEAKTLCPANACSSINEKTRHDTLVSDAHRDQRLAFVSAGIGGAALMAAVYLWWRPARPPSTKASAGRFSVRPSVALGASFGGHLEVGW